MPPKINAIGRGISNLLDHRQRKGVGPIVQRGSGAIEAGGPGEVTTIGRLNVQGWVSILDAEFVSLRIGGLDVIRVRPIPESLTRRTFRMEIEGLWSFVRSEDSVTLHVDGTTLPICVGGRAYAAVSPTRSGEYTVDDLRQRLDEGYVFSHSGVLQMSRKHDIDWQVRVFALYSHVSDLLASEFDLEAFLIYGTLLGAVREGGYLAHDMDFDAAYLSREVSGPLAAVELTAVARTLIDAGLDVDCQKESLHIHDRTHPEARIDLFHLFFDKGGELKFPFGVAGSSAVTREHWSGLNEFELPGGTALVPAASEAVVEHIYGPLWRTPNPSFDWGRDRVDLAIDGQLSTAQRDEVHRYWVRTLGRTLRGSERRRAAERRIRRVIRRFAVRGGFWPETGFVRRN